MISREEEVGIEFKAKARVVSSFKVGIIIENVFSMEIT
jgi:hypothetical protein